MHVVKRHQYDSPPGVVYFIIRWFCDSGQSQYKQQVQFLKINSLVICPQVSVTLLLCGHMTLKNVLSPAVDVLWSSNLNIYASLGQKLIQLPFTCVCDMLVCVHVTNKSLYVQFWMDQDHQIFITNILWSEAFKPQRVSVELKRNQQQRAFLVISQKYFICEMF